MHHRAKDLTGLTVGYLTATKYHGSDGRKSLWETLCVCGKTIVLPGSELVKQKARGVTASCGCMKKVTMAAKQTSHGMSFHPGYWVWRSMLARCANPKNKAWRSYGGRGIKVCAAWRGSFEAFWADMGPTYVRGLTLEREKNHLGYSPANCAWATYKQQASNTRANRHLDTPRGRMTAAQAADSYGIGRTTLYYRLDHGWPLIEALTTLADFRNRCGTS